MCVCVYVVSSVGPFQSDALLVPEHCVFDHVHNSRLCSSYDHWNHTALQSCNSRGQQLQNFAILQPCGIDKFNGVEFVCCPRDKGNTYLYIKVRSSDFWPARDWLLSTCRDKREGGASERRRRTATCVYSSLQHSRRCFSDGRTVKWFYDDISHKQIISWRS